MCKYKNEKEKNSFQQQLGHCNIHVNSLYFSISPQMELSEQDTSTSQYMRYKSIESKYMGKPTDTIYFQKHLIIHNQDIFDCNLQFLRSTY